MDEVAYKKAFIRGFNEAAEAANQPKTAQTSGDGWVCLCHLTNTSPFDGRASIDWMDVRWLSPVSKREGRA